MNRLKYLRTSRGLFQSDVAKIIGVTTSAYGYYENGKRDMSTDIVATLANFFNVSTDYLLGVETNNKKLLPVLGVVKAGYNYLAQEHIIDYIEAGSEFADAERFFALLVKGDSMSPHIDNGDYVIVQKTDGEFESGKVCVVLINGEEGTVKRVFKTDTGIELHAFNTYYPAKKYTYKEMKDLEISILGVVVRQIRNWR